MKHTWMILSVAASLFAKDFGSSGTSFPIEEKNPIDSIECKTALHEEALKQHAQEIEQQIQNPIPLEGIGKAIERKSTYFDPTYLVQEDIEVDGEVIVKAGTQINPLEKFDLPGGLLLFDGSDPAQVAWAKKEPPDFKWVLVKGSPIALEEQEGRPVYFDQLGFLSSRFEINNVPARVKQDGTFLLIEEIPVNDEGAEKP